MDLSRVVRFVKPACAVRNEDSRYEIARGLAFFADSAHARSLLGHTRHLLQADPPAFFQSQGPQISPSHEYLGGAKTLPGCVRFPLYLKLGLVQCAAVDLTRYCKLRTRISSKLYEKI